MGRVECDRIINPFRSIIYLKRTRNSFAQLSFCAVYELSVLKSGLFFGVETMLKFTCILTRPAKAVDQIMGLSIPRLIYTSPSDAVLFFSSSHQTASHSVHDARVAHRRHHTHSTQHHHHRCRRHLPRCCRRLVLLSLAGLFVAVTFERRRRHLSFNYTCIRPRVLRS